MSKPLPPAMPGLPIIGNLLEYQRDPVGLLRRGYEEHGPIFSIRLGPKQAAVLIGPENHQFFFTQTGKLLSRRESLSWMIPMFGSDFPVVAEESRHRELLPLYSAPFHESRMDGYVQTMARQTSRWLDTLGDAGEFELVETVWNLILAAAAATILSEQVRERSAAELPGLFSNLAAVTQVHSLRNVARLFPLQRRRAARTRLRAMVRQALDERRANPQRHHDFMDALLSDGPGSPHVSDEFLVDLLIGLTWVGLDTTTGQLCWSVVHLLQHDWCLQRVLAEQAATLQADTAPHVQTLDALTYLQQALKESERLRPTVMVMGRRVSQSFELGGYRIPAGWLALVSPPLSHRLPDVFADPDRFDPDRFGPDRAEDRRTPFSLIGFGAGRHVCTGKRLAHLQMKTFISLLLRRFELELLDPTPTPTPGPHTNRPRSPLMIRYRKRNGQAAAT